MAGTEPQVQGKIGFPVIALEIAVMQLMEIGGCRNTRSPLDLQLLKSDVTLCRCKGGMLGVHQHMDRVRGYDPVNQDAAEVKNMLERVHGQSGPGTDIDVFVMEMQLMMLFL